MKYQGTITLEVLEGARNYNDWIAASLLKHVKYPIIEIGAGIGNISDFIKGNNTVLTEIDKDLLIELKDRFRNKKNFEIKKYDILTQPDKTLSSRFNSVMAVNVLEHIENDNLALQNMNSLLKKNGKMLILVPAVRKAYTKLDKSLGHFRRYQKNELREKVENAGFEVENIYYFNFVGLFSWILRDIILENNAQLSTSHIAFFDKFVPIFRAVESKIKPPVGISLICIANKK